MMWLLDILPFTIEHLSLQSIASSITQDTINFGICKFPSKLSNLLNLNLASNNISDDEQ